MKSDILIIDTLSTLEEVLPHLQAARILAVDLEADSLYHYQEKVCLLQIATRDRTFVLDPLSVKALDALKGVFEDPGIRKIFHGADYDIRSLYRDFRIEVRNLFDTELACRFLGHEKSGLDAVLAHYFGINLDKRFQKKDWSQRPLPEEMILYAAKDTAYLIPLSELLRTALKQKRRLGWVEEECRILSQVRPHSNPQMPFFYRFKGAGKLRPRELAVLEAILAWRDEAARKKDRPPFKILGNQEILKLIETKPFDATMFHNAGILSPKQVRMFGKELYAAVTAAREIPREALPLYPRENRKPTPEIGTLRRIERLKQWRDKKAEKLGLDPALLMNKETLGSIAALWPPTLEALSAAPELKPWQRRAFSRELMNVLVNK